MKKSTFEGKRVIVAACAAVAMVMGAMSVGASVSNTTGSQPKSSVSTLATAATRESTTTTVKSTPLSSKRTLEVRDFLLQQNTPLYTTPQITASTPKDVLSPALGLVNPALFMAQIIQLQQPPLQPGDTPATSDVTTPTGTAGSSGAPASATPETPPSTTPATTPPADPEPAPSNGPPPSPGTMNLQSTDPPSTNKQ
jgi:hypothetical protein